MTDYAEPRDVWTERTVVGGLLAAGKVPDEYVVAESVFWDPHLRAVAAACMDLAAKGKPCDPVTVRADLLRTGQRSNVVDGVWLFDLMQDGCATASLTHHTSTLKELAVRREVMALATRALQAASNPVTDAFDIAATLSIQAGSIADSGDPVRPPEVTDGADFMEGPVGYDWLVPGLLERGDRLLITGGEGSGKSVMTRQLALTAAAGVHPFKGERMDPLRVLLVDLENGTRHLRRALRVMWDHATYIGRPIARGMLTVESRPSGIDLTKMEDQIWLKRLCDTARPEILVIGPLYRMHAGDMNDEVPARMLTRVIDDIRAVHNCAVVMETHSPHGVAGARTLRPVGSSLFMRWPEFGYGLRPKGDDDVIMNFGSWRGPRDERDFPRMLARGGEQEWPWASYNGLVRPHEGWAS